MQRPPPGVKLVIEAVCIMKGIKPKKVPGEKPGSKVDDYWEPGKGLLQDPGRFLESLFKFDKVTMLSIGVSPWVGFSRMENCLPHQYLPGTVVLFFLYLSCHQLQHTYPWGT